MTVMYVKLYSTILRSSIWLEDASTRLLWITMLSAADEKGFVFGSPAGMAHTARIPPEDAKRALDKLSSPDPDSSDLSAYPENEGRRVEIVEGGWRIINYMRYRKIRDSEERREQNREAQERWRGKVSQRKPRSAKVSPSEEEAEKESNTKEKVSKREGERFAPPTLEEVVEYGKEIPGLDVPEFFDFYTSKGWKIGSSMMKDWKSSARRWLRRDIADGKVSVVSVEKQARKESQGDRDGRAQALAARQSEKLGRDHAEYHRLLKVDPEAAKSFRERVLAEDAAVEEEAWRQGLREA